MIKPVKETSNLLNLRLHINERLYNNRELYMNKKVSVSMKNKDDNKESLFLNRESNLEDILTWYSKFQIFLLLRKKGYNYTGDIYKISKFVSQSRNLKLINMIHELKPKINSFIRGLKIAFYGKEKALKGLFFNNSNTLDALFVSCLFIVHLKKYDPNKTKTFFIKNKSILLIKRYFDNLVNHQSKNQTLIHELIEMLGS